MAAFFVDDEDIRLLKSALFRVGTLPGLPHRLELGEPWLVSSRLPPRDGRLLVLVVAFEEDGGTDIRTVHQKLSEPEELELRLAGEVIAAPMMLRDFSAWLDSSSPHSLPVSFSRGAPGASGAKDDFVGACLIGLPPTRRNQQPHQLRFVSPDRKNDWTATLLVKID